MTQDDVLRARERSIREGSATAAEVEAWDAQRIRSGLWSAELVGRQVLRVARRLLPHEGHAREAFDVLRGLVNEARGKTHWVKADEVGRVRNHGRRNPGTAGRIVVVAVEPDQVALAVIPRPLRTLPHLKDGAPPWELPSGRGILVDYWFGGWHPSVCEWIDREGPWKLVAPREVVGDWAGVHWRTT